MTTEIAEQTPSSSRATPRVRLFWQPGCSSCVKVKEFLSNNEVDFQSVNILEDQDAKRELIALRNRSVPVLLQGDRAIYAQSLDDVAKFVGKTRQVERLAPEILIERWLQFLRISRELITRLPTDKLEARPVPERERSNLQLSYHIFQIPESLLETVENGITDSRDISNAKYDHLRTAHDLLTYADTIISRMERWQACVSPDWFGSTVETYYGEQPAMQVLERGTWHSGQHARQLDFVVTSLTGTATAIPASAYVGLPMPDGIWQ